MSGREVVLDVETTGLEAGTDKIIEIGCVEIVDLIPTGETFHVYINPQMKVSAGAFRVHGLSDAFLSNKPTFRTIVPKLRAFLADSPLVIHNAPFDTGFLNAELTVLGYPKLKNPIVDTLELSRQVKSGGKHTLDSLCRHFGVNKLANRKKHGALLDAQLLAEVYLGLRGGLQTAFDLPVEQIEEEVTQAVAVFPERDFDGPTLDEYVAHLLFVRTLPKPVWSDYMDVSDFPEDAIVF